MKNINKEEILKKARDEKNDEYEKDVETKSINKSVIAIVILCCFFAFTKPIFSDLAGLEKGIPFFEFGAIILGFLSVNNYLIYKKTKKKENIVVTAGFGIAFIANTVLYFISMYDFYVG